MPPASRDHDNDEGADFARQIHAIGNDSGDEACDDGNDFAEPSTVPLPSADASLPEMREVSYCSMSLLCYC